MTERKHMTDTTQSSRSGDAAWTRRLPLIAIVLVAALWIGGPWMLELITTYATRLISDIPLMIG